MINFIKNEWKSISAFFIILFFVCYAVIELTSPNQVEVIRLPPGQKLVSFYKLDNNDPQISSRIMQPEEKADTITVYYLKTEFFADAPPKQVKKVFGLVIESKLPE